MSKQEKSSSDSLFQSMLSVSFIVLKLCHKVDWSWWVVLLPLYASTVLEIIFIIFATIVEVLKNEKR